nr:MAG TPA: hypothetical protein [Bacteriophage sp.]
MVRKSYLSCDGDLYPVSGTTIILSLFIHLKNTDARFMNL